MAAILREWDPVAGLPTLRDMTRICSERYARPDNGRDWTNQNLAVSIARFTLARDKAGDPKGSASTPSGSTRPGPNGSITTPWPSWSRSTASPATRPSPPPPRGSSATRNLPGDGRSA